MSLTVTTLLLRVSSSSTVLMVCTIVSFCMSKPRKRSPEYTNNSHSTPTVIEKQNATMAR